MTLRFVPVAYAADMQGGAPDKDVLELFSLARSRLDAPLLTTFLHSAPQQLDAQDATGVGNQQQQATSVEVTRVMASISRPSTVKIHQMAKSVLKERNDARQVGWARHLGALPAQLPCTAVST